MIPPLRDRLGLGPHELVSVVGAGGKSTIVFGLGDELTAEGARVIVTTTTKVAPDQPAEPISWSAEPPDVERALGTGRPVFVASERGEGKIIGISPAEVDRLFVGTSADHVVVEADGARMMSIKAPAGHEPAIPPASTLVVVVASAAALGRPIAEVAHRPELVAALLGCDRSHALTEEDVAAVLLHPRGGLSRIPDASRVVMAITHVTDREGESAGRLGEMLASHQRVDRAVSLGAIGPGPG
jgi:probable selenium-dependent hydroxylase accessory protein YqeC